MAVVQTESNQLEILNRYYVPSGKAWNAKWVLGSNLNGLLSAFAREFARDDEAVYELIQEMMPDTTTNLISNWESAVGIPDGCIGIANDIETRRKNVITKLSMLGLQTQNDFESFATGLGLNVKVRSGIDHDGTNGYGTELPNIVFADAKTARFTIVVTSIDDKNSFDYDFDFPFQTAEQQLMECIFRAAKPANCDIIFVEG